MSLVLSFLDGVRWHGEAVVGDRPQALLAALAEAGGRVVAVDALVEAVWADEEPANPAKALQVLVSRVRSACAADVVERVGEGYRLGVTPDGVDAWVVGNRVKAARVAFESDPATAARLAGEALALGVALPDASDEYGPLADLHRTARAHLREATRLQARATSRMGQHAEALPALEQAHATDPTDEALFADLLRSEAATRGAAAAIDRFGAYRSGLRDRLGTDPGPELQRVHGELLALDSPVRDGVRFDATDLLGRDTDIRAVHALLATSRVVTVLGAGGLGKTRLAHVLGRQATQPVVHFVELVSVTAAEDLIGEVGSSLGVRDSVSSRRTLTPEQRADVRARIAQHLDQAPSLLILDNCEHIVAAVADLVAYLVATTRSLRVLTTSRAPLAIAAETVYPLGELSTTDGAELFRLRATAARPEVHLDEQAVTEIVTRLDGLPLAIELAAAKVRVMGVADIARRLENRFALLRGGDRSAPDRHQTLIAVIDWSWNLLAERERRALRWLSVFHDGFSLDAAESVLGPDALEAVANLADQSLVTVVENGSVRYRMLETVREFGRMQLVDAGEDHAAQEAHRLWAIALCRRECPRLRSAAQFDAVEAIHAEEGNLSDVLRRALVAGDPATAVSLLATLGSYWAMRGEHGRVIVLIDAVVSVIEGWTPPADLADETRIALVITLNHGMIAGADRAERLRSRMAEIGPGSDDPRIAAQCTVALAYDSPDMVAFLERVENYTASSDRHLALLARQMLSHARENVGDPAGGVEAALDALALAEDDDGPWLRAILHTQVSQLQMQAGDTEGAARHAASALPTLQRLGAIDDVLQLRALMALAAIRAGRLEEAEQEFAHVLAVNAGEALFGSELVLDLGRAELSLARGDHPAGLAYYRDAVTKVRAVHFAGLSNSGLWPWILFGESAALTAHAFYATDADLPYAQELRAVATRRLGDVLDPAFSHLDFPVAGLMFYALGSWGLLRDGLSLDDAVRCLVFADRFAYNRGVPTMAWDHIVPVAEDRAPGRLAEIGAEYGTRRGPELLDAARALVKDLGA